MSQTISPIWQSKLRRLIVAEDGREPELAAMYYDMRRRERYRGWRICSSSSTTEVRSSCPRPW